MKPLWQNVQQEAPDELVGGERHRAIPGWPVKAIDLEAEGHPALVERDEPSPPPARVGARRPRFHRPARTARLLWESYAADDGRVRSAVSHIEQRGLEVTESHDLKLRSRPVDGNVISLRSRHYGMKRRPVERPGFLSASGPSLWLATWPGMLVA